MFRRHNQITVIAPIAKDHKNALSELLDKSIGYQAGDPVVRAALNDIPTLHFVSLFILNTPGCGDDEGHLVIEANFDGQAEEFLTAFTTGLQEPLSQILRHCAVDKDETALQFLKRYARRPQCFYVSCPGLTRAQILEECDLLVHLQSRADRVVEEGAHAYPDADTVIRTLRDDALCAGALSGEPATLPFLVKYGQELVHAAAVFALMVLVAIYVLALGEWPDLNDIGREPFFLVGLGLLVAVAAHRIAVDMKRLLSGAIILLAALTSAAGAAAISNVVPEGTFMAARYAIAGLALIVGALLMFLGQIEKAERVDHIYPGWLDIGHMRNVCGSENSPDCMQNHFVNVSVLKDGKLRMWAVRAVLWLIHVLGLVYFNRGRLGGIPSIHFARWIILDSREFGKSLLVFMTNYDASWDSYLGDFVDDSSQGVSGIWSNTFGFPRTWNLMTGGGSRFEKQFKAYARRGMLRTQAWFTAYPNVSVREKLSNAKVRRLMMAEPSDLKLGQKADLLHYL